jgi:hypothetical protein
MCGRGNDKKKVKNSCRLGALQTKNKSSVNKTRAGKAKYRDAYSHTCGYFALSYFAVFVVQHCNIVNNPYKQSVDINILSNDIY